MTQIYFNYLIVILLGLIVGSFLNVIILRFDELKTIVKVRSHCRKCKKEIPWYDLVPFFSYIALRGKCRACKEKISIQYPLVELATALIFTALFWKFGLTIEFAFLSLVSCILIIVFTYDILHLLVADILVYAGIALWVIYLIISYFFVDDSFALILNSLYGGLVLGGFLAVLVAVSKEKWMGAGDIGIGFLLGFIVGWPNVLVTLLGSFVLGGLFGLILIALKAKNIKDRLPFAPFLIAATWIALLWGNQILAWYFKGII